MTVIGAETGLVGSSEEQGGKLSNPAGAQPPSSSVFPGFKGDASSC